MSTKKKTTKRKKSPARKAPDSRLVAHAKRELEMAGLLKTESGAPSLLGVQVLELVNAFSRQNHTNQSAVSTVVIFNRLVQLETLTDNDHSYYEDVSHLLNKEAGTVFRDIRNPKWLSEDGGKTWYNAQERAAQQAEADKAEEAPKVEVVT
jgi:hypothetical protein